MMTLLMCAMFCQVKEIRSRCNIGSIACVNFLFCPMSSDWACVSVRVNVSSVPITFLLIFPVSRIHCVHCPSVEIVSLTGRFHVKHHFSNLFIGTLKKLTFCELYFCPFLFVFSPNRLSLYCFWNIVPVCNHHSVFSRLHNFFRPVYIQEFANVYVSMKYRTVWLLGQPLFCGKVDERIGII